MRQVDEPKGFTAYLSMLDEGLHLRYQDVDLGVWSHDRVLVVYEDRDRFALTIDGETWIVQVDDIEAFYNSIYVPLADHRKAGLWKRLIGAKLEDGQWAPRVPPGLILVGVLLLVAAAWMAGVITSRSTIGPGLSYAVVALGVGLLLGWLVAVGSDSTEEDRGRKVSAVDPKASSDPEPAAWPGIPGLPLATDASNESYGAPGKHPAGFRQDPLPDTIGGDGLASQGDVSFQSIGSLLYSGQLSDIADVIKSGSAATEGLQVQWRGSAEALPLLAPFLPPAVRDSDLQDQPTSAMAPEHGSRLDQKRAVQAPPLMGDYGGNIPVTKIARNASARGPGGDPALLDVPQPDDLTVIRGIGPVIQRTLQDLGYATYLKVSEMTDDEIKEVTKALGRFGAKLRRDWISAAAKLHYEKQRDRASP